MPNIKTILFDADGVIQQWSSELWTTASSLIPDPDKVSLFIKDLATAEAPCLRGDVDLRAAFAPVLSRWGSDRDVGELLDMLTLITPNTEILDIIDSLRRQGVKCCLATNQQPYRAVYMSTGLGYAERFDAEFYSCYLGKVKPETGYFEAILGHLDEDPGGILFIDDRETNLAGARSCGLQAAHFNIASGAEALRGILASFVRPGAGRL